jgi:hypothetical protein
MIHLTLLVEPEKGREKNIYPINDVFYSSICLCVFQPKQRKRESENLLRNETEE